jgi:hypothetical protein
LKRKLLTSVIVVVSILTWGTLNSVLCEDLEWTEKEELNLDASPLDVAASADGKWLFVLTPDQLLVYSNPDNKLLKKIPVGGDFDRVAHSPEDNTVVLSSSRDKSLKFIELDLVHAFDVAGLPFKGPKDAPVTVAVFGDYQ